MAASLQSTHPAAPPPSVDVIVLNWNGKGHLEPCLESIEALRYRPMNVVLVDNGSTDGSADEASRRHDDLQVVRLPSNTGYSGGNNAGIRASTGDLVLLVNNDTILEPDTVDRMVEALGPDPQVAACSPKVLRFAPPGVIDSAGLLIRRDLSSGRRGADDPDDGRYATRADVFGAHGACAMYRRSALEDVGLFDEDLFAYNEEFDLAWRLRLRGHGAVFSPDARVRHRVAASLGRVPDRILHLLERNRVWTIVKNAGAGMLARHLLHLALGEWRMLRHCAGIRTLVPLAARVEALRGLGRFLPKRREIQGRRTVPDAQIERWMV